MNNKFKKTLKILRVLNHSGFSAVIVGGAVRDKCMGLEPKDFDIATDAPPEKIEMLFPRTLSIGKKFGVILVLEGNDQFEVATFRKDSSYSDGRHPDEVHFSTIREDVFRRDFTINGLFWDLEKNQIIDLVGGQEDIRKKLIRCIGNPFDRFEEDKLRILRAIRFASNLNFKIDPKTWKALCDPRFSLDMVSRERIRIEFEKILTRSNVFYGLTLIKQSGLSRFVFCPGFFSEEKPFPPLLKKLFSGKNPLSLEEALVLCFLGSEKIIRYRSSEKKFEMVSGWDTLADSLKTSLKKMSFSRKQADGVYLIIKNIGDLLSQKTPGIPLLRKLLGQPFGPKTLSVLSRLERAFSLKYSLVSELEKISKKYPGKKILPSPLITGKDLIKRGFEQGPFIAKALEFFYDLQLSNDHLKKADLFRKLETFK